jgi:predicted kinase
MEKIDYKSFWYSRALIHQPSLISFILKVIKEGSLWLKFILKIKFISILQLFGIKRLPFRIITMCGCPGTGKTTIAQQIHKEMNGTSAIIHRDKIRELRLGKKFFYPDSDVAQTYLRVERVDRELFERAKKKLRKHDTIILDAGFREHSKRNMVYEFAKKYHCEVVVIHCTCNDKLSQQRLQEQIDRREKNFSCNRPLEKIIEYYSKTFEEPKNKLEPATTIIKVNTEQLVPGENLSSFVKQLIQTFEHFPPMPEFQKNVIS